jgi:hypothetical protein
MSTGSESTDDIARQLSKEEAIAIMRNGLGEYELKLVTSFCAPIYWVTRRRADRSPIARNGTAFFLDPGPGVFGVTACHVINGWIRDRRFGPLHRDERRSRRDRLAGVRHSRTLRNRHCYISYFCGRHCSVGENNVDGIAEGLAAQAPCPKLRNLLLRLSEHWHECAFSSSSIVRGCSWVGRGHERERPGRGDTIRAGLLATGKK